jgi:hypothetical protein
LLACAHDATSGPPEPQAGQLAIDLATASPTLGAVAFVIVPPPGGSVAQIVGGTGLTVYQRALSAGRFRVVLVGTLGTGEVLRFTVPDLSQATAYGITAEAGADRVTFALIPTSQFTLTPRPFAPLAE